MITDNRELNGEQLKLLYNSAHCFVLPTTGEGWGLTLTEAMATGCPSIWTHCSAMLDYADEKVGYPITEFQWGTARDDARVKQGLPAEYKMPVVDPRTLLRKMQEVYSDWERGAWNRGKAASDRMHSRYTWAHAAQKLVRVCEKYA